MVLFNPSWEGVSYITTCQYTHSSRVVTVTGCEEQTQDAVCPGSLTKTGCLEVYNCRIGGSNFSALNFVVVIVCL